MKVEQERGRDKETPIDIANAIILLVKVIYWASLQDIVCQLYNSAHLWPAHKFATTETGRSHPHSGK